MDLISREEALEAIERTIQENFIAEGDARLFGLVGFAMAKSAIKHDVKSYTADGDLKIKFKNEEEEHE